MHFMELKDWQKEDIKDYCKLEAKCEFFKNILYHKVERNFVKFDNDYGSFDRLAIEFQSMESYKNAMWCRLLEKYEDDLCSFINTCKQLYGI